MPKTGDCSDLIFGIAPEKFFPEPCVTSRCQAGSAFADVDFLFPVFLSEEIIERTDAENGRAPGKVFLADDSESLLIIPVITGIRSHNLLKKTLS